MIQSMATSWESCGRSSWVLCSEKDADRGSIHLWILLPSLNISIALYPGPQFTQECHSMSSWASPTSFLLLFLTHALSPRGQLLGDAITPSLECQFQSHPPLTYVSMQSLQLLFWVSVHSFLACVHRDGDRNFLSIRECKQEVRHGLKWQQHLCNHVVTVPSPPVVYIYVWVTSKSMHGWKVHDYYYGFLLDHTTHISSTILLLSSSTLNSAFSSSSHCLNGTF